MNEYDYVHREMVHELRNPASVIVGQDGVAHMPPLKNIRVVTDIGITAFLYSNTSKLASKTGETFGYDPGDYLMDISINDLVGFAHAILKEFDT